MTFAQQLEQVLAGRLSPRERREAVRLQGLTRRDRSLSTSDQAWLEWVHQRELARARVLPEAWPFPGADGDPIARGRR